MRCTFKLPDEEEREVSHWSSLPVNLLKIEITFHQRNFLEMNFQSASRRRSVETVTSLDRRTVRGEVSLTTSSDLEVLVLSTEQPTSTKLLEVLVLSVRLPSYTTITVQLN